ncbi:alpha-1,2-fucosyltransferase [Chamaesiphon sp. OTE_20_metabat_361]|uniref:alpha-1,2-fucosyltransferase n=1 Tax=Chamaesiphon sp. OTE_20_metabat_361 TaxID=2964689 RepID=UPI00286B400A|nr:alpha-1,2-fucosyltransferase [Chamaesiphon sp. OTE_20_metabat_361]
MFVKLSKFISKIDFHLGAFVKAALVTTNGWVYFSEYLPSEAIIISIGDGIGNQLFKYAFGISIAKQLSKNCIVDIIPFQGDMEYQRSYKLEFLGIKTEQLLFDVNEESLIKYFAFFHYLKLINRLIPFYLRIYVDENDIKRLEIHHQKSSIRKCVYFSGYWQNKDYISSYSYKIIQSQILEKCSISTNASKWLAKIENRASVAVHIRQTKFNPRLQPSYYIQAYDLIKKIIPDAKFYIFADDWEWAENNLPFLSSSELVKGNNDIDDFYLLLYSRNTIIANSTFSWWAAYLKPYEQSIIIYPKLLDPKLEIVDKWIKV